MSHNHPDHIRDAALRTLKAGANGDAYQQELHGNEYPGDQVLDDPATAGSHSPVRSKPSEEHPELWERPAPLAGEYVLPDFPVDCLPSALAAWVAAEAEATQTPPDLAGMLTLAVCAAALAKKVRVAVRPGWSEPLNLFSVVALPPGDRKSAVYRDAIAPVEEVELEERDRQAPLVAERAVEHRLMEKQLQVVEARAAKAKDQAERQRLTDEARELAKDLAEHEVPPMPRFFCDEETPESLTKLLAEQGGRILQASAEGTAFEIAKGRYSDSGRANFDVYLKGHAGDPLRVGRVSRGHDTVDQPALSVALAVQPDVIRGLAEHSSMRGRGFLARFLYSVPASRVGWRTTNPAPVPLDVADQFRNIVTALWRLPGATDEKGRPAAQWLEFSPDANRLMESFERWLEPQLAPGEELSHLAGWANKLAGAVVRIAGILQMAEAVSTGADWQVPIGQDTVAAAIRLGRDYLLPHALAAFGMMGADERLEDIKAVAAWLGKRVSEHSELSEKGVATVSKRDLHQAFRTRFKKADDVDPMLKALVEYGYLRRNPHLGKEGPGRSSSPTYLVNPLILSTMGRETPAHNTQNPQNGSPGGGRQRDPGCDDED